jgi:hypothetical protein
MGNVTSLNDGDNKSQYLQFEKRIRGRINS